MSNLIKLDDGCYVAADQIAELSINRSSNTITVRMKNGVGHCHEPGYKQSIYAALDELAGRVNQALKQDDHL